MTEPTREERKARRNELAVLRKSYRVELRKYRKRVGGRLDAVKLANRGREVFSTPSLPKAAVYEWVYEFRGKQYELTGVAASATLVPSSDDDGEDCVEIIVSTKRNETAKDRFDKRYLSESQHFVERLLQQSALAAKSQDRRVSDIKKATESLNHALLATETLDQAELELAELAGLSVTVPSPIQLTPSQSKSITQRDLFKRIDANRISWRTAGASGSLERVHAHLSINRGKTVLGIVGAIFIGLFALGGLLGDETDLAAPAGESPDIVTPAEKDEEIDPSVAEQRSTEVRPPDQMRSVDVTDNQAAAEEIDPSDKPHDIELLRYEVLEDGDTSIGTAKRESDSLLVLDIENVTRERVEATISSYIAQYKGTAHAVAVYVYSDPAEFGDFPPAFGAWQWAPGGEWAAASSGNPTTWDGYQWSLPFDPGKLDDATSCNRPSPESFAAVNHFYDTLNPLLETDATLEFDASTISDEQLEERIEEYNRNVQSYESESTRVAAEVTGLNEEQVQSAIVEVSEWVGC